MIELKKAISNATSLQDLADILKDSNANISFWGGRYIVNENYSSTVSISFITKEVISKFLPLLKSWDYSLKDRKNISIITQKLDGFYLKTDEDLHKCNIITKIFNWIINFIPTIFFSIRRKWNKMPDLCCCYSERQFKETFKKNILPDQPDEIFKGIKLYLPPENPTKAWYNQLIC